LKDSAPAEVAKPASPVFMSGVIDRECRFSKETGKDIAYGDYNGFKMDSLDVAPC
jgi:hypothetical protein